MSNFPRLLVGDSVLPPMNGTPPLVRPLNPKANRTRARGRFAVLNSFVDETLRDLDGSAVKVWLILYRDTKPDGLARASDADLARRAGVSVRTIYNARKELEWVGLLRVVRRGRLGAGCSVYRIIAVQPAMGCRLPLATDRQKPRRQVAGIPEGDQKGRPDSGESDAGKGT